MKMMTTAMFSPRVAKMMLISNTIHHKALPSNELQSTGLTSAGFDSTQQLHSNSIISSGLSYKYLVWSPHCTVKEFPQYGPAEFRILAFV